MLDLSSDEKAKHFLPRWLRDAQYQCRAEMIVTMSTSCQSRRFAIRDSGMGAMLRPRRRAMDRAAMRPDGYHVGKLAFCREIAGDVLVVSGHCTKFFAGSFVGIEHYDGLAHAFLEIVERRNEVGVSRYEHDAVEVGLNMVNEHLGGDVYVRAFLLGFPHGCVRNLRAGAWRGDTPMALVFLTGKPQYFAR